MERWGIYFSGIWCIYILGLFACADALLVADVSAIPWYSLLQMIFSWPMYLQLAFLWTCRCFSACLSCTIASASCLFWDLKILPLQILHLHPIFSITWRCSPVKLRILVNLLFQCFADALHQNFASSIPYRRYRRSISFEFYLLNNLSQYITYKKITLLCVSRSWNLSKNSYIIFL